MSIDIFKEKEINYISKMMEEMANTPSIPYKRQPGERNLYELQNLRKIKEERNASKQEQLSYVGRKRYS
jgi:hypothetical protein